VDWSAFAGGATGSVVIIIILVATFLIWDQYDRRENTEVKNFRLSLSNILESQLEKQIVQDFDQLFPGWKIYNDGGRDGIRFHTGQKKAGEIDILCIDAEGDFVVIELKRGRAPDHVISQTDRYIAWVQKNLAKPEQKVRGIIIAKGHDSRLVYSLMRRNDVSLWEYNWELSFNEAKIPSENE